MLGQGVCQACEKLRDLLCWGVKARLCDVVGCEEGLQEVVPVPQLAGQESSGPEQVCVALTGEEVD